MKIHNWKIFQHFKERRPLWIKLYRHLLDDKEWFDLSGDDAKLLVELWSLASEDKAMEGNLPELADIAWKLRRTENAVIHALHRLTHWIDGIDISAISTRYQDDSTRREEKRREETEKKDTPAFGKAVAVRVPSTAPNAVFVRTFAESYEAKTGQPYKADDKDYIIAAKLINAHGSEACILKAQILGVLCEKKSAWFTGDGFASFTIGKLSNQWNAIIPESHRLSEGDKLAMEEAASKKKWEDHNASVAKLLAGQ